MPREGAIIFLDMVGKLDVLNVECDISPGSTRLRRGCCRQSCAAESWLFNFQIFIERRSLH
jgi:hypothetical protein